MSLKDMESVAHAIVAPKKGILAADESNATIAKRFEAIKVESTEENRRRYRELLFTTPKVAEYISGVILYDETIRQRTKEGEPFPAYLARTGIIPGIKVDTGAKPLAGSPEEKITEGLDGLRERLREYYGMGARFAKWRAVITIGNGIPTRGCIEANAHALARYAALCQEANIVPIVEPEVLMDADNTIEVCEEVTTETLRAVYRELATQRVALEGTLLKPNMVIAGKKSTRQASVNEVAEATLRVLRRRVPAAVPGIVFLSGGQTEQQSTEHLNVMSTMGAQPWALSFSYGRALQQSALRTWGGKEANFGAGQREFYKRSRLNGLARSGAYRAEMEAEAA
jgi:fructose-bisphosphate aldolase, class I